MDAIKVHTRYSEIVQGTPVSLVGGLPYHALQEAATH